MKDWYESLDCEMSYIAFRADINAFLREQNEVLSKAPSQRFVWGTKEFDEWSKDMDIEDLMKLVLEYYASTIYSLPLPQRVQKMLFKANVKYIDDLKELITDPANLSRATGLGLDIIQDIIIALSK